MKTMKMKTMLGLTIVALMLVKMLASCSKDVVSSVTTGNPNAIGFEMSTGKTRATVNGLVNLQNDENGFGVYATNKGATANLFIDNKAYRYDGVWKWAGTPIAWPSDDADYPVNFYAYYPKDIVTLTETLEANYTIAATPAAQEDFMAANKKDVMYRPVSGNVNLAFKHILSKIDFKIVTGTNVTAVVQSIAVKNVGNEGTFNFAGLSWTAAPASFPASYNFMAPAPAATQQFEGTTTGALVTGSSGSLMLRPQNLEGRGWDKTIANLNNLSYIEVVYRIYDAEGKDLVGYSHASDHPEYEGSECESNGYDGPLFVKVGYPLPTNWLMGKAYIYNIFLGTSDSSGGNLIDPDFKDEDGDDTDLPVVGLDPEDPIIDTSKPIGFIVDVDDWDELSPNPDLK